MRALLLAVACASLACVRGIGDPCVRHTDCDPGLACTAGSCQPCGEDVACVGVELVVRSCDPDADPLDGVRALRLTIEGEGLAPIVKTVKVEDGSLEVPGIPFGGNRWITVEGLDDLDADVPLSRGVSNTIAMGKAGEVAPVTVFLRRAHAFSPAQSLFANESCTRLSEPRSGHSATLLPDGRVLLAGGESVADDGTRVLSATSEFYDPASGLTAPMFAPMAEARAGHTATLLDDGSVLVAGGFAANGPTWTAELYDPKLVRWSRLVLAHARAGHVAFRLPDGRVLLAGGIGTTGGDALDTTELYDPKTGAFSDGPALSTPRRNASVVALPDGAFAIVGGENAGGAVMAIDRIALDGGTVKVESGLTLGLPRARPVAFPMSAGAVAGLFVAGTPLTATPLDDPSWEFVPFVAGSAVPVLDALLPPLARDGACAASFAGGVLLTGGADPSGDLLASADVVSLDGEGKLHSVRARRDLATPRTGATCTTLADGTILVSGGETFLRGRPVTSFELEIFQP